MTDAETSCDISERPSGIVRIAYHQSSVMCGTHDLTARANGDGDDKVARGMSRRLLGLPLFATMTAALREGYTIAKGSHASIATILGHAEDGMRAGMELASPVTGRVADALETPLKAVDDAVCVGLDYVEEKVSSAMLPAGQIYVNMKNYIRNIFTSALETLRQLFGGLKNQIESSSTVSETTQRETRKASS